MNKKYIGFLLIFVCYLNNFGMLSSLWGSKKEEVEKKFPGDIFEAIDQQNIKAVVYYIAAGQVNCVKKVGKDKKRLTPLVNAIKIGNEEIIRLLISCGADTHKLAVIKSEYQKDRWAVEWAVRELWLKDKIVAQRIIALLLETSTLNEKSGALREACILGRPSLVKYLLEQGADPLPVVYSDKIDGGDIASGEKKIVNFNSFAMATDPEVRDILFTHVIAQMKKEKPEFAAELERTYKKDEVALSHDIELGEEEQREDGLRKRK